MSGHVFHPGHDDLHGITVVVEGASGRTYVGRWHERTAKGIVMHDVATHEPTGAQSQADFLVHILKYGVRPEERTLLVTELVNSTRKLADL
jgi:hypothetical protein